MRMFNRKTGFICALLFCILLLSGCEDAPEQRAQETAEKDAGGAAAESLSVLDDVDQYVSLGEAREQIQQMEGKDMDGIYLPKHMMMPDSEEIYDLELTPWRMEQGEDMLSALEHLWKDYAAVDWENIPDANELIPDGEVKIAGFQKTDEETGFVYAYSPEGHLFGDSLKSQPDKNACVEAFDFEWGDTAAESDVYPLSDGEVSVPDAVAFTEELFNTYMSVLEKKKFTYKVQHLYVLKNGDACDFYMVLGKLYKGMPVSNSCLFQVTSGQADYGNAHGGVIMEAVMRHKNCLDQVNSVNELLGVKAETKLEKLISPLWAVKKISEEVAHIGGLRFQHCGLFYMKQQDNSQMEEMYRDSVHSLAEGGPTRLRPVWLFMAPAGGAVYDTGVLGMHGTSIIVDAVDGELYYYDMTGGY